MFAFVTDRHSVNPYRILHMLRIATLGEMERGQFPRAVRRYLNSGFIVGRSVERCGRRLARSQDGIR